MEKEKNEEGNVREFRNRVKKKLSKKQDQESFVY